MQDLTLLAVINTHQVLAHMNIMHQYILATSI